VICVQIQDGSRKRYDSITLPYEVYLNKSVVSKKLAKLEADGLKQRIQYASITSHFFCSHLISENSIIVTF
jgi:hypothetical protein